MATDFLWGEKGWSQCRHWWPIAVNSGKDPEVIDAAACTFLHEGRIADFRCVCTGVCYTQKTALQNRSSQAVRVGMPE
jgi:hypothetical protein